VAGNRTLARLGLTIGLSASIVAVAAPALAYDAMLSWQSVGPASGYNVYARYDDQPYAPALDIGLIEPESDGVVRVVFGGLLMGPTTYFAIGVYDSQGVERGRSNELSIDYATAAMSLDSDGDGLLDGEEDLDLDGIRDPGETDPLDSDSDDDGLTDSEEVESYGTNPLAADSDGDGYADGTEVTAGTDPNHPGSGGSPQCGNGVAEATEACDDGNGSSSDGCLPGCTAASCGDGYTWSGVESCDDGSLNDDADLEGCRTDCSFQDMCGDATGDGVVTATDAAIILSSSVGLSDACRLSSCDVDGNNSITASDSIRTLQAATGMEAQLDCLLPVAFTLDSTAAMVELSFAIHYDATGSAFAGQAAEVDCEGLAGQGVSFTFDNASQAETLYVTIDAGTGIAGPTDLGLCRFLNHVDAGARVAPQDFTVALLDYIPANPGQGGSPTISVSF